MLSENEAPFRGVLSMFVRRLWVLVWSCVLQFQLPSRPVAAPCKR